ncbi:hypothetical protein E2562_030730 [Oryza meyeriana var. granulata]|uniref:Uncharacterized protein n=1 Tax=Oryza meyeriana var. granulata TaxID=110450 RepID=A0A6G1E4Y4_9ORYZ|nr:hypothetical protein E2562_030730 [Oryza meyeriana var. granulata]
MELHAFGFTRSGGTFFPQSSAGGASASASAPAGSGPPTAEAQCRPFAGGRRRSAGRLPEVGDRPDPVRNLAAVDEETRWGIFLRSSRSRPSPHDGAATRGHLGLIRAHPGLRDLNSALASRDAFFLDAAHALAASALRVPTVTGEALRFLVSDIIPRQLTAAESESDADALVRYRLERAILDAREGRFDEALAAAVRLTRDNPGDSGPQITAAALCFLHGRSGTGYEWIKSVPKKEASFSVLRARPICGERLREMRALSEHALVDADLAAVDINLFIAFLATRDGHFNEALQRYKAAVRKDPSDCRPYELAALLGSITGRTTELDAWQQAAWPRD